MVLILKKTLFNIASNFIVTKHSISKALISNGKNVKTPSITKTLKSSIDKNEQEAPRLFPKRPLSAFFRYAAEVRSEVVQKNPNLRHRMLIADYYTIIEPIQRTTTA